MSRKTIALISGLVLLTIVLVALAVKTSQPSSQTSPTAQNESNPTTAVEAKTMLYMAPATVTGNTASVNVGLDSQDNEITAVQMEISYDPKVLSFVSVTPSSLFAQGVPLINTVDRKNGRISYAVGLSPQQVSTPHTGKIDVATLEFTKIGSASGSTSTEIQFLPKSLVSARGVAQSVLKGSTGTTVKF